MSAAAAAAEACSQPELEELNERQEAIKAWYTDRFMRASSQAVALMIAGEFFETEELSQEQYDVWLSTVCEWRATLHEEANCYDEVAEDSEEDLVDLTASADVAALRPGKEEEDDITNTPPNKRKRE